MLPNNKDEVFHRKAAYEAISTNNQMKDLCSKVTEFAFHLTKSWFYTMVIL